MTIESLDIDSPRFRRTTNPSTIYAQRIEMRLSTRRGTYFDDPDYGIDLDGLLLDAATAGQRARIEAEIAGEIEKEDWVDSATVRLPDESSGETTFFAEVTPIDGPTLSFTISVVDGDVSVLDRST